MALNQGKINKLMQTLFTFPLHDIIVNSELFWNEHDLSSHTTDIQVSDNKA